MALPPEPSAQIPSSLKPANSVLLIASRDGGLQAVEGNADACLGGSRQAVYALGNVAAVLGELPAQPGCGDAGNAPIQFEQTIADCQGRTRTLTVEVLRADSLQGQLLYWCRPVTAWEAPSEPIVSHLLERSPDLFVCLDRELRCTYLNPAATAALGVSSTNAIGCRPAALPLPPQAATQWERAAERVVAQGTLEALEFDLPHPDGGCNYHAYVYPATDASGDVQGLVVAGRDLTEAKQAESSFQQELEREHLIARIARNVSDSLDTTAILDRTVAEVHRDLGCDRAAVYQLHADWSGSIEAESVSAGWRPLLGTHYDEPCFRQGYGPPYRQGRYQALSDVSQASLSPCHRELLEHFQARANLVVPITDGQTLWGLLVVQHCAQPYAWPQDEIELLRGLATQVSIALQKADLYRQLELANQEWQSRALRDGVTQIANRACFDRELAAEWSRLSHSGQSLALIMADVDRFKLYNDTFGHQAGDDCLAQVATVLSQQIRRSHDLVARYGGEEFAFLLPQARQSDAMHVAKRAQYALQQLALPHAQSGSTVTMSFGIAATVPSPDTTPAELVEQADRALYWAKAQGRNCIVNALASRLPSA
jgi:diguanylate cyclase (GGDEF)-like protein/PAS domain S-box-containing protein